MAKFFEHQDRARRVTRSLIPLILVSVVPVFLASYVPGLLIYVFIAVYTQSRAMLSRLDWWMPDVFLVTTAVTLVMLVTAGLIKTYQLSKGGRAVAESMNARAVRYHQASPRERQLLNVVAEMALAAGIPMPRVYILEEEPAINAFAAGYTPRDAVVVVSRGCLEELDRDELQAVVAHEVSHILNGDTRLNMRLMAIVYGLVVYHVAGNRMIEESRTDDGRVNGYLYAMGVVVSGAGALGSWMGKAIKGSINRQREFLADASAIQFTRNSDAVVRVLKKIGGHPSHSYIKNARAEEISHLFFSSSGFLSTQARRQLLNSHPPLDERVRRYEPAFSGRFEAYVPRKERLRFDLIADEPLGEGEKLKGEQRSIYGKVFHISAENLLRWMNASEQDRLDTVRQMLRQIPAPLHAAAVEDDPAPFVCALFLEAHPEIRRRQLQALYQQMPEAIADEVARLAPHMDELPAEMRLPLFDLCVPGLRQIPYDKVRVLLVAVDAMIEVDERATLFEVALRHLVRFFGGLDTGDGRFKITQFHALRPLNRHVNVILSALAHLGHQDEAEAEQAHRAGLAQLQGLPALTLLKSEECDLVKVGEAMEVLGQLTPKLQQAFFTACVHCVAADETVTAGEAELLRALGHVLDCPLPPMAATA
jgi:Zn-dependent protease with chaperone function